MSCMPWSGNLVHLPSSWRFQQLTPMGRADYVPSQYSQRCSPNIRRVRWDVPLGRQSIAGDPVTCAKIYNRRIQFFQKKILLCSNVLVTVMDYAGIDEFQARGAPHTHMKLWNRDAPIYKQDNKAEVIAFYDQHGTTASDLVPSKLAEVQRHSHSNRCSGKCSFGFPKPPMSATDILEPLLESEVGEH